MGQNGNYNNIKKTINYHFRILFNQSTFQKPAIPQSCWHEIFCRPDALPVTNSVNALKKLKKVLREMQTLRAGCSKAEPKIFAPPQTPFPAAQDGQNLISWRWSLPLPINPVWWRSMHAISSYRGNRPTNTQTGPITIHCAAKLSVQCINTTTCVSQIHFVSVSCCIKNKRSNECNRSTCWALPVESWLM